MRPLQFLFALFVTASFAESAGAAGGMLSFFPEDVATETSRPESSAFNVAALTNIYKTPAQIAAQRRLDSMKSDIHRLYSRPPKNLQGESDLGCTAAAVFFEARGESTLGQEAVASVVVQRAITPDRWGQTACEVIRPVQFSFMTSRYGYPSITAQEDWQASWIRAVNISARILAIGPIPEISGADHYHADYVWPIWRHAMPRTAVIGQHRFYADPKSLSTPKFRGRIAWD